MKVRRAFARLRAIAQDLILLRRAANELKALCRDGRGPVLRVSLRIVRDNEGWDLAPGLTGISYDTRLDHTTGRRLRKNAGALMATCVQHLAMQNRTP
ncbi:hypothetical protein EDD29_0105 [Actinocorallia herbida]|uniref:Uncharacterized protein n=1 Tax=Actinocorallia herbida TaxID=58109 RepID=A0A3N1CN96_9ACTN|nr:hypothetical protein [Actinocorallia herbida]ROO82624.1 hypothetical protein EDD29_0105 [Actinocorallia herbida]